jgi:hypothetical protein
MHERRRNKRAVAVTEADGSCFLQLWKFAGEESALRVFFFFYENSAMSLYKLETTRNWNINSRFDEALDSLEDRATNLANFSLRTRLFRESKS